MTYICLNALFIQPYKDWNTILPGLQGNWEARFKHLKIVITSKLEKHLYLL